MVIAGPSTGLPIADVKRRLPIYVNNPVLWAKEVVGFHPDQQQEKILAGYLDRGFDAVKSGHGVGKSATASIRGLHFLSTRPFSIVPCTAPTRRQLRDVLWKEFAKWIRHSPYLSSIMLWEAEKIRVKGSGNEWYAAAVTSRAKGGDDTNVGLQGFHAGPTTGGIHFIVDEASGVPESSMSAVEGALTEENAFALMIGNPTHLAGTFYNAFGKDSDLWHKFTLSCVESSIVDPAYYERMAKKYGLHSDMYRVKVLGEFPRRESEGLVPLAFVLESFNREASDVDDSQKVYGGLDVALSGANRTVLMIRRGNNVFFKAVCEYDKEERIAQWAVDHITHYKMDKLTIDCIGPGSGVASHLRTMGFGRKIIQWRSGDKPISKRAISDFYNIRAQAYWFVRSLFYDSNIALSYDTDDELLTGQLTNIRVFPYRDQVIIESKKDMKKRSMASPDDSDALILCFSSDLKTMHKDLSNTLKNFRPIKPGSNHPFMPGSERTIAPSSPNTVFGMIRPSGWRLG